MPPTSSPRLFRVITSISMDHEAYLGTTLGEIAGEKAGIIKPGAGAVHPKAAAVIAGGGRGAAGSISRFSGKILTCPSFRWQLGLARHWFGWRTCPPTVPQQPGESGPAGKRCPDRGRRSPLAATRGSASTRTVRRAGPGQVAGAYGMFEAGDEQGEGDAISLMGPIIPMVSKGGRDAGGEIPTAPLYRPLGSMIDKDLAILAITSPPWSMFSSSPGRRGTGGDA